MQMTKRRRVVTKARSDNGARDLASREQSERETHHKGHHANTSENEKAAGGLRQGGEAREEGETPGIEQPHRT